MSRSRVDAAALIEIGHRLKPASRPGETGTVVALRPGALVGPSPDARAPSDIPHVGSSGPRGLRGFFARLIARIELADFPRSCCG